MLLNSIVWAIHCNSIIETCHLKPSVQLKTVIVYMLVSSSIDSRCYGIGLCGVVTAFVFVDVLLEVFPGCGASLGFAPVCFSATATGGTAEPR